MIKDCFNCLSSCLIAWCCFIVSYAPKEIHTNDIIYNNSITLIKLLMYFVIVPLLLIVFNVFCLFRIKQAAKVKYITLFHTCVN